MAAVKHNFTCPDAYRPTENEAEHAFAVRQGH